LRVRKEALRPPVYMESMSMDWIIGSKVQDHWRQRLVF